MNWRHIRAIVLLPGNALVVIPIVIGWVARGTDYGIRPVSPADLTLWPGAASALVGLFFCVWTMRLFTATGEGTPAPWDPIRKLVITGPYRHVRNPMITGVIFMLVGETLVFRSLALLCWTGLFVVANLIYLPFFEEPGLAKRYGDEYRRYKSNVPRWLPRLQPWTGADEASPNAG